VFVKVFHFKGVMRFGKKGKLSPQHVGPMEILERVGLVAYRLALPREFASVHDVLHVFMLKRYHPNPYQIIPIQETPVNSNLTYTEYPTEILEWINKVLCNKKIPIVKVQW
ncbi:uncharacterized protein LOC110808991, partial [Carica papaya]|uniref:uncharacterized protein LOC110808991 n=1 Tax=Carica papaya TaxID=3649 RepID=UPI000B8C9E77